MLRAALARYAQAVWSLAQDLPSPENTAALVRSARPLAPYLNVARNALFLADHARSIFDSHTPFQPHLAIVVAVHGARDRHRAEVPATY